jgi:hypothetical protein
MPIWLIIDHGKGELCLKHPGYDEDLVVEADAEAFVKWHMGWHSWAEAVKAGPICVTGDRALAKALPTWNKLSRFAGVKLEPARV